MCYQCARGWPTLSSPRPLPDKKEFQVPVKIERKLKQEANKKGLSGKREDAYVYGTMNKAGLMHGNKITAKGKKAK
jgi:hypothetical protein